MTPGDQQHDDAVFDDAEEASEMGDKKRKRKRRVSRGQRAIHFSQN
jgi:hypothetical protein